MILINLSTLRSAKIFTLIIEANYSKYIKEISKDNIREKIDQYFKREASVDDAIGYIYDFKETRLRPYLSKYGINNTKELFNNNHLNYFDLTEKHIYSYSKLKEQYGTVELDQLLFDLGIKTSWALTALKNVLEANKELQLDLTNSLNGENSITEK